jgi:hypothetical protein
MKLREKYTEEDIVATVAAMFLALYVISLVINNPIYFSHEVHSILEIVSLLLLFGFGFSMTIAIFLGG